MYSLMHDKISFVNVEHSCAFLPLLVVHQQQKPFPVHKISLVKRRLSYAKSDGLVGRVP